MTSYIEKFVMNRQHVVGIFLDISSAFDSIDPNFICSQLRSKGVDDKLTDWYINYIKERHLNYNISGHSGWIATGQGFPQGGSVVLSFGR